MTFLMVTLPLLIVAAVLRGWTVMLGLGIAHSVIPAVPAVGIIDALWLALAITLVLPTPRVETRRKVGRR